MYDGAGKLVYHLESPPWTGGQPTKVTLADKRSGSGGLLTRTSAPYDPEAALCPASTTDVLVFPPGTGKWSRVLLVAGVFASHHIAMRRDTTWLGNMF